MNGVARTRLLAVAWCSVIIAMAVSDAQTGNDRTLKIAWWVSLFFVAFALSAIILVEPWVRGLGAGLGLGGLFLGPYNTVWYAMRYLKGQGVHYPIYLFPFRIHVDEAWWWGMIGIGFAVLAAGTFLLFITENE